MKQKLIKALKKFSHLFPSALPRTGAEFDTWADDIIEVSGLPDNPSYRQALGAAVMHLGPVTAAAPKSFFARSVKKAVANHVAFAKIQQYKKEEKEFQDKVEADLAGEPGVQKTSVKVVSEAGPAGV